MSRQIEIVQSGRDEMEFVSYILKREDVVCLPRLHKEPMPIPVLLGACSSEEQVLFLTDFRESTLANVRPLVNDSECFQIHPFDDLVIEWTRTKMHPNGGYLPGRFYFRRNNVVCKDSSERLNRLMSAMMRKVRQTYTSVSYDEGIVFMGPHFATALEKGEVMLVYPDGSLCTE
jgi:hypothetical protein